MKKEVKGKMEEIIIKKQGGIKGGESMKWDVEMDEGDYEVIKKKECESIYR